MMRQRPLSGKVLNSQWNKPTHHIIEDLMEEYVPNGLEYDYHESELRGKWYCLLDKDFVDGGGLEVLRQDYFMRTFLRYLNRKFFSHRHGDIHWAVLYSPGFFEPFEENLRPNGDIDRIYHKSSWPFTDLGVEYLFQYPYKPKSLVRIFNCEPNKVWVDIDTSFSDEMMFYRYSQILIIQGVTRRSTVYLHPELPLSKNMGSILTDSLDQSEEINPEYWSFLLDVSYIFQPVIELTRIHDGWKWKNIFSGKEEFKDE